MAEESCGPEVHILSAPPERSIWPSCAYILMPSLFPLRPQVLLASQVAAAYLKPRILPAWLAAGKPLSLEMCREGWACVYEQSGAVYGDLTLEDYKRVEKEAQ